MKYECEICGAEFDGYEQKTPFVMSNMMDYVRIQKADKNMISIAFVKCCPKCIKLVWDYVENLTTGADKNEQTNAYC